MTRRLPLELFWQVDAAYLVHFIGPCCGARLFGPTATGMPESRLQPPTITIAQHAATWYVVPQILTGEFVNDQAIFSLASRSIRSLIC